jgi:hypothetical protein
LPRDKNSIGGKQRLYVSAELPRVCRRLFGLGYAAKAVSCNWA